MPEWTVLRPQQAHVSCQVSKVLYNCHGTTQSLLYLWQCCTGDIYQSMADRCIAPLLEALKQGHLLQVFHLLGQLFSFASSAFNCKPIGIFKCTKCVSKAMLRDQICFLSIYIFRTLGEFWGFMAVCKSFLHENFFSTNLRKFSPTKVFCYTVCTLLDILFAYKPVCILSLSVEKGASVELINLSDHRSHFWLVILGIQPIQGSIYTYTSPESLPEAQARVNCLSIVYSVYTSSIGSISNLYHIETVNHHPILCKLFWYNT